MDERTEAMWGAKESTVAWGYEVEQSNAHSHPDRIK